MKLKLVLAAVAMSALFASCGGEKKEEKKEKVTLGSQKPAATKDANAVNLALAGNDQMRYDKDEFTVQSGQEVTLTLRHTGKIGVDVMGHNFVLLKKGVNIPAFSANAAAAGKSNDWIPEDDKDVIVHSKMIGGGQSTSITFTAPEPGTYDFICSFPGHSGLMKGKFIVK